MFYALSTSRRPGATSASSNGLYCGLNVVILQQLKVLQPGSNRKRLQQETGGQHVFTHAVLQSLLQDRMTCPATCASVPCHTHLHTSLTCLLISSNAPRTYFWLHFVTLTGRPRLPLANLPLPSTCTTRFFMVVPKARLSKHTYHRLLLHLATLPLPSTCTKSSFFMVETLFLEERLEEGEPQSTHNVVARTQSDYPNALAHMEDTC